MNDFEERVRRGLSTVARNVPIGEPGQRPPRHRPQRMALLAVAAVVAAVVVPLGVIAALHHRATPVGPSESVTSPVYLSSLPPSALRSLVTATAHVPVPVPMTGATPVPNEGTELPGVCNAMGKATTQYVVTVLIGPDTSEPACVHLGSLQTLRIVNRTADFGQPGGTITVSWQPFAAVRLRPGQSVTFPGLAGTYLLQGTHTIRVTGAVDFDVPVWFGAYPPLSPVLLPCSRGQLVASIGRAGPAAGTENIVVFLRNTSQRDCWLGGLPSLRGVRPDGSTVDLGFMITANPGDAPASPVTGPGVIAPGEVGGFVASEGLNNCPKLKGDFPTLRIGVGSGQHVDMPFPPQFRLGCPIAAGPMGPIGSLPSNGL